MTGEISFIELGVGDVGRGRTFYGELFGWTFTAGPSGDEAGAAIDVGGTPGGLHGDDAGVWPYVFFRVDDLDVALERVRELGGTVDSPPGGDDADKDAQFGRFRMCQDDQGSRFGLHEPPTS